MIKQIRMHSLMLVFALVFSFWGGIKAMATPEKNKSGELVSQNLITDPLVNYKPNGDDGSTENPFKAWIVGMDWDKQYVRIVADLTNCKTVNSSADCVFSLVGAKIADGTGTKWSGNGGVSLHVYYTATDNTISSIHVNDGGSTGSQSGVTIKDKSNVVFEISKEKGLVINGVQTKATASSLANLTNMSDLTFSSEEGIGRMHGWYKSVKVINKANISNTTNVGGSVVSDVLNGEKYVSDGTNKWTKDFEIDWSKQKVIAELDVTACSSLSRSVDLFSIGDDAFTWGNNNTANIHLYRSATGSLSAYSCRDAGYDASKTLAVSSGIPNNSNTMTIELSKSSGFVVNGHTVFSADAMKNSVCTIFNLSQLKVGSGEGNNQVSNATYNFIKVVTNDYSPEVSTVTTSQLKEGTVNTLASQSNAEISLDRSFENDGYWYTFCVPFSLTADSVKSVFGDDVKLRTFDSVNGNTLIFAEATNIEAGVPYLLMPSKNVSAPTFIDVDIVAPTDGQPAATEHDGFGMQGIYSYTDIEVNGRNIYLSSNNTFKKISDKNHKMKGTRAYFYVPDGTNLAALKAEIDGVETSLGEALTDGQTECVDNRVYNLQGQYMGTSLNGLQRGVYVQNGKKIVVNK